MIQSSPGLEECARAHEEAVITNDEYKVRELFQEDKDIKYIVDLGANLGTASFKFHVFFPEAKILACEPVPELMRLLKLNTNNDLIYVQKAIVGSDDKEVKFNVCHWAGNGHVDGHFRWDLFEPMGSKKEYDIQVEAQTLKSLIDEHNFPRIDLLKIDVEGLEGAILLAFKPYMKQMKHFRGEWHGDDDIPRIKDALEATHNVKFDRTYTTHGDIFADLKPEFYEEYNSCNLQG